MKGYENNTELMSRMNNYINQFDNSYTHKYLGPSLRFFYFIFSIYVIIIQAEFSSTSTDRPCKASKKTKTKKLFLSNFFLWIIPKHIEDRIQDVIYCKEQKGGVVFVIHLSDIKQLEKKKIYYLMLSFVLGIQIRLKNLSSWV